MRKPPLQPFRAEGVIDPSLKGGLRETRGQSSGPQGRGIRAYAETNGVGRMNLLTLAGREAECRLLQQTLWESGFNVSEAARRLRMVGPSGQLQDQQIYGKLDLFGLREWFETTRGAYRESKVA